MNIRILAGAAVLGAALLLAGCAGSTYYSDYDYGYGYVPYGTYDYGYGYVPDHDYGYGYVPPPAYYGGERGYDEYYSAPGRENRFESRERHEYEHGDD